MPVEAVLITNPAIDFTTFLGLAYEALGYNIAGAADASHRQLADAEKFLFCLAELKGEDGAVTCNLLSHVSFSVLIVADERDLLDILERASSISFVRADTTAPGVNVAVLTGTLAQWRNAIAAGTSGIAPPSVRTCFSKILLLFDRAGLTAIWGDLDQRMAPDQSGFLLDDQRGRT